MLFFAVAILLCAVRDAQCKTRESPKNLWLEKKEGTGGEGGGGVSLDCSLFLCCF